MYSYSDAGMNPEEAGRKNLETYVKGWKIFIDTCSLLEKETKQLGILQTGCVW